MFTLGFNLKFLFNFIMIVLTKDIQKPIPYCMFFADDITFTKEWREAIKSQLEL